jgi:adenylate kinase family enzyme
VRKICIIGSPGSGKSTLAKIIGNHLEIEVIHLDTLFWKAGWVSVSREQLELAQASYLMKHKWIMDGTYSSVWKPRIEKADTIIFLDFSRWVCLYRIFYRYWKYRKQTRSDMGKDCPEKIDFAFIRFVWNFPKKKRGRVFEMLQMNAQGKQIIVLRNRKAVADFLSDFHSEIGLVDKKDKFLLKKD